MNDLRERFYFYKELIKFSKEQLKIHAQMHSDEQIMDENVLKDYLIMENNNYNNMLNNLNNKYGIEESTVNKIIKKHILISSLDSKSKIATDFFSHLKNISKINNKRQSYFKIIDKNPEKFYKKISLNELNYMSEIKNLLKVSDLEIINKTNPAYLESYDLLENFISKCEMEEFFYVFRKNDFSPETLINLITSKNGYKKHDNFCNELVKNSNENERVIILKELKGNHPSYEGEDIKSFKNTLISLIEKEEINNSININPLNNKLNVSRKRM